MTIGLILFLIFMTLKLMHEIDWSWWWIVSPILIEFGLQLLVFICFGSFIASVSRTRGRR